MIRLYRAGWSQRASQCLIGFDEKGGFIRTDLAFASDKPDCYVTSSGVEIQVVTWQPDGTGYNDNDSKGEG